MGQIANQMLLEWCHKIVQKIADRKNSGKEMMVQETSDQKTSDQKTVIQKKTGPSC